MTDPMQANDTWWKDFFSGLVVDMWCQAVSEDQTLTEAGFILDLLELAPPAAVLDVPCGSGRLSIELARRGFAVTGVDISEEFLRKGRSDAAGEKMSMTLERREMRDLPWLEQFEGVVCFGNSFGFLDDAGNAEFLDAVYRVLRPGGRFLLDASSVAENVVPRIQKHTELQVGDILFIEDNHYDHERSRLETDYTFIRGNVTEKRFGSHRLYTFRELQQLLTDAGFASVRSFGSLNKDPFELGAPALYMLVTKD